MEVDVPNLTHNQAVCAQCPAWARVGSKYCSNACGIAAQMVKVTTEKAKEEEKWKRERFERRCAVIWAEIQKSIETKSFESSMEAEDAKMLKEITEERETTLATIERIKREQESLESDIAKYQMPTDHEESEEGGNGEKGEKAERGVKLAHMDCPYCGISPSGHNISLAQHLSSCFQKFEIANPHTGAQPTPVGDVTSLIYCDHFDVRSNSYCKKLKASCAIHSGVVVTRPLPGTKSKPTTQLRELCGAPTAVSSTKPPDPNSSFAHCRILKRDCGRHWNWDNLARQQLELQLISHSQLAEALLQEHTAIKEKLIFGRLARGLRGNAQTIPESDPSQSSSMQVS